MSKRISRPSYRIRTLQGLLNVLENDKIVYFRHRQHREAPWHWQHMPVSFLIGMPFWLVLASLKKGRLRYAQYV